ncbi:hypothetical protein [Runella sp.]|uniref:hypothetical protein n=1 Tax=Runella sp. TaxID=1960881 RepID=UPI003D0EB76D
MELNKFKEDCIHQNPDIVVQKHLIDGSSFFFRSLPEGEEFAFKKDIANSLDVHIRDIVIVGSGKLGFSIKPDKDNPSLYLFKKFDYYFEKNNENEKSDLDIAIVSSSLFDQQLINLHKHTGGYTDKTYPYNRKVDFAKYIIKGWLRPDMVPRDYSISSEVIKVQDDYKRKFGRKVSIGIYKSWYFFETYHQNNIKSIQLNFISVSS